MSTTAATGKTSPMNPPPKTPSRLHSALSSHTETPTASMHTLPQQSNGYHVNHEQETMDFITDLCDGLDVPCTALAVALTVYHQFCRYLSGLEVETAHTQALRKMDAKLLCVVCVNIAVKATDAPRKVRDIVNVAYNLLHPGKIIFKINEEFWRIRDSVGKAEFILLRVNGFRLDIPTAYPFLVHVLNKLCTRPRQGPPPPPGRTMPPEPVIESTPLAQLAFTLVGDMYRLASVCMDHAPNVMAMAAFYMAVRMLRLPLEMSSEAWCGYWDEAATVRELEQVMVKMLSAYESGLVSRPSSA